MPLCRAGELSLAWKQAGLEDVHEQPLDITMRFGSFSDYWDAFLLGQGPVGAYVRGLDRDKLQALRGEVRHRLTLSADDVPFRSPGARVVGARDCPEAFLKKPSVFPRGSVAMAFIPTRSRSEATLLPRIGTRRGPP